MHLLKAFCSTTLAFLAIGLVGCENQQAKQALMKAEDRAEKAEADLAVARAAEMIAIKAQGEADKQRMKAEQSAEEATKQQQQAEEASMEAIKARDQAAKVEAKLAEVTQELEAAKARIAELETEEPDEN
jgi:hypothetical protein